jgi:hypothetical protein
MKSEDFLAKETSTDRYILTLISIVKINKDMTNFKEYKTISDLQSLIDDEIEESTTLEYKRSFAIENPKWKRELAKDVSAMANSNGGTIIYGIGEKEGANGRSIPKELFPIKFSEMSKDRLSQLISSNIQPTIDNIEISCIHQDELSGYFVVTIPQSKTAHQNRLEHVYYKRRNATVEAMEDYEIRDVMNRSKTPIIDLSFSIIQTTINVIEIVRDSSYILQEKTEKKSQRIEYKLKIILINNGQVLAKYVNYFVYIPKAIISKDENFKNSKDYDKIFGDNTLRDLIDSRKYGPVRYDPILPGLGFERPLDINLNIKSKDIISSLPNIKYEMHADNAPERIINVPWKNVNLIQEIKDERIDPFSFPALLR